MKIKKYDKTDFEKDEIDVFDKENYGIDEFVMIDKRGRTLIKNAKRTIQLFMRQ